MSNLEVHSIGKVRSNESGTFIALEKKFIPALQSLEGFSHISVLWWFSDYDDEHSRSVLQTESPYKGSPEVMGIFATRSPMRPNPIALTAAEIIQTDFENGIIQVAFMDAYDNTPVLDIKPYTPSLDRVETPGVPAWCSRWPRSTEESGSFNWAEVFNF
ncbi:SAM-dependent methyltransferase [Paenibacillus sonchi]|uniref:SAM-dependent methyltransferase n=1 Tax=Paenibacillus sonchi TaxID=373687 RepID=A0A974SDH4_9BACL|nr:SAM-dependent methyltransferase [Paenibacillus sonchi]QQZ61887.1 SAM-dependent methyltransferase [Paenibacillus sonchi]